MQLLKNAALFLAGFLKVGVLLTVAIIVVLIVLSRRRIGRRNQSFLGDSSDGALTASEDNSEHKSRNKAR